MTHNSHTLTRRDALRLLAAGALTGCAGALGRATGPVSRPNVLFIQADDLGWSDLGCYGASHYATPAIDMLARDGLRFTQAYAGAPICTPSRACLVTGVHCARLHTTGQPGYKTEDTAGRKFAHPEFRTSFPVGTPCVARTLAGAGYRTALFGKWGFEDDARQHGFAETYSGTDGDLVDDTLRFLERHRGRPVFAYLNTFRPHVPLRPAPDRIAAFASRPTFREGRYSPVYAAELEAMDRDTGRLLDGVDNLGLRENTVVVFTSDNGGFLGTENERLARNTPLREGKASLYEGGIRVPLIVRWPGVAGGGATSSKPVHGVDWHATLAAIAGATPPAEQDGVTFAPLLRGSDSPAPRPLYWHYPHYRRAMPGISASPSSAVREGDWKLLHFYETDAVELYHLGEDPGETRNLAGTQIDEASRLRGLLETWRSTVGAQPPIPN